jgi:hypothetical protein
MFASASTKTGKKSQRVLVRTAGGQFFVSIKWSASLTNHQASCFANELANVINEHVNLSKYTNVQDKLAQGVSK